MKILIWIGKPFFQIIYHSFSFLQSLHEVLLTNKTKKKVKKVKTTKSFGKLLLNKIQKEIFILIKLFFGKKKKKKIAKKRTNITFSFLSLGKRIISKKALILILPVVFLIVGLASYLKFDVLYELPQVSDLETKLVPASTKILDRNGILLYEIYKDHKRTAVKLENLPNYVQLATMAAEDSEFEKHHGVSFKGLVRSGVLGLRTGQFTGGSTITQQLVKNALLTPERTITRKVKEMILAVMVERKYSKEQIMEMYLNQVGYGGTAYGIEEAAETYFGKSSSDLSLSQAALLAGLPQNPSEFSPFINADLAKERKDHVLFLMKNNKFISDEEYKKAVNEEIVFAENRIDIKAPHFVMYVKNELIKKYGEYMVENGGLTVNTTLDYNIQKIAEDAGQKELQRIKNLHVGNAASLVLRPSTGEILAMVGSNDYFDIQNDGNVNLTTSLRQPGSSIKVVNYAYALSHGLTAASMISDNPTTFKTLGQLPYTPHNYDGKFRGEISIRSALAESRNIPAVKILAKYGVDKMIDLGEAMGITTWTDRPRFGLSLTLGGGETRLTDLASVYATIANYGAKPTITSILNVKNYKGKTLEDNSSKLASKVQVIDPRVAYILIDILKDNNARAPAFGSNSALKVNGHPEIAVKTGTSNDLKDNLAIGFNQNFLVATWVGNNDNSPMSSVASGVTGASPIWNSIISKLVSDTKYQTWVTPLGLAQVPCPSRNEWFKVEDLPQKMCEIRNLAEEQKTEKTKS